MILRRLVLQLVLVLHLCLMPRLYQGLPVLQLVQELHSYLVHRLCQELRLVPRLLGLHFCRQRLVLHPFL